MKIQKVLLSRIDVTSDNWDRFLFDLNPSYVDRLAESFDRVGQIYPLILMKDMEWLFFIAGYPRYLAMKKNGVDEAWARIFQENEISPEEALWLSLEEGCARQLSPPATFRVFKQFKELAGYSDERLAKEVAPAIGLESSSELVQNILSGKTS